MSYLPAFYNKFGFIADGVLSQHKKSLSAKSVADELAKGKSMDKILRK